MPVNSATCEWVGVTQCANRFPLPTYTAAMATLRFSPFVVDLHRHALMRDGTRVPLSARLVKILGHLASNPGALISKNAMLDLFWPDAHVAENTVDRTIARIRKALDDDAGRPMFIQTISGEGYRFIAAVDTSGAPPQRDAFDEWMKGRLSLESLNAVQLHDATAAFERVLACDETYGPAQTALANAYFLQYELTRPENTPNRALLERAVAHAQQACVLDPMSGEAWATLGCVLTSAGHVERARAAARRATALQPSSWRHWFRLAMACWGQERLDAVDRTLALMPDFAPAYLVGAMVFVARQAFSSAEQMAAKGAARQTLQREAQRVGGLLQLRPTGAFGGPKPRTSDSWQRREPERHRRPENYRLRRNGSPVHRDREGTGTRFWIVD